MYSVIHVGKPTVYEVSRKNIYSNIYLWALINKLSQTVKLSKRNRLSRRKFIKQALTATGAMAILPSLEGHNLHKKTSVFESSWQGTRAWLGPEYWASPMQDWRIVNSSVVCGAASQRVLQLLTHCVSEANVGGFEVEVRVRLTKVPTDATLIDKANVKAGIGFGVWGRTPDYRSSTALLAHKLIATIDGNGRLTLIDEQSDDAITDVSGFINLHLQVSAPSLSLVEVTFKATTDNGQTISMSTIINQTAVKRNIVLLVDGPATDPEIDNNTYDFLHWEWQFESWTASGDRLEAHVDRAFGPIFCSQYTLSPVSSMPDLGKVLKLSVQFPPLEVADNQQVMLEYWPLTNPLEITELWQPIIEYASVAIFTIIQWNANEPYNYRLSFHYLNQLYTWEGGIRAEPVSENLTLAALSCDNGFMFPNSTIVENVTAQNPDMLFFAGDQIYESNGLHGIIRTPWPLAMRCYFGKYLMFCWCWRKLLKDRPSVIMPDDHDVFQGNLFGHGGRPIPGAISTAFSKGGYTMHPSWVNAVQLTQTAHLPDPFDSTPILQEIEVYYTQLTYGRVSFAILEDRKWKTGFASFYPGTDPDNQPDELGYNYDHPDAILYGQRQHDFLKAWTTNWEGADLKCILTQTPPCQLATNFADDLLHTGHDFDSNGWPQTPRNESIKLMRKCFPLIVSGDQHFAALAHMGADQWEDGPCVVCVPGVSNGFARAFIPATGGEHGDPTQPNHTGRFQDPWGNKFTMLAVGNPDTPSTWDNANPQEKTHNKGSGHGFVRFNTLQHSFEVNVFRMLPTQPNTPFSPANMFPGFPKTIRQSQNYAKKPTAWLPEFYSTNQENIVIEVWNEATNTLEYTFRISGKTFKPHTFSVQKHRVVLRHNDATQVVEDLLPNQDFYTEDIVEVNW